VGFIVTASCFLVLLFYVDLNRVIAVLYVISSGSAVANIIARPLLKRVLPRRSWATVLLDIERIALTVTLLDAASTCGGLGLSLWWYFVRTTASYAWVLQDIMGASLCVLFLSLVRFPNIKVATVLLCLAFVYGQCH
jgi:signal peptide peptidase-like protein 2B